MCELPQHHNITVIWPFGQPDLLVPAPGPVVHGGDARDGGRRERSGPAARAPGGHLCGPRKRPGMPGQRYASGASPSGSPTARRPADSAEWGLPSRWPWRLVNAGGRGLPGSADELLDRVSPESRPRLRACCPDEPRPAVLGRRSSRCRSFGGDASLRRRAARSAGRPLQPSHRRRAKPRRLRGGAQRKARGGQEQARRRPRALRGFDLSPCRPSRLTVARGLRDDRRHSRLRVTLCSLRADIGSSARRTPWPTQVPDRRRR